MLTSCVDRQMDIVRSKCRPFEHWLRQGTNNNILVFDEEANVGEFTKRLISLMKTCMRRNGGGHMTHLFISPEAYSHVYKWIPTKYRSGELYLGDLKAYGVELVINDNLGENQYLQKYFTDDLKGCLQSDDVELCLGIDINNDEVLLGSF